MVIQVSGKTAGKILLAGAGAALAYYGCRRLRNWWRERRELEEFRRRAELDARRGREGGVICDPPPRSQTPGAPPSSGQDKQEASTSQQQQGTDEQQGPAGGGPG